MSCYELATSEYIKYNISFNSNNTISTSISKDTYNISLLALLADKSDSKVLANDSRIHLAANYFFKNEMRVLGVKNKTEHFANVRSSCCNDYTIFLFLKSEQSNCLPSP